MMTSTFLCFISLIKQGIIFASNRPSASAKTADTVLPGNSRYNIFLINDFGDKPNWTRLHNYQTSNMAMPVSTQYNVNHFTFVSDENESVTVMGFFYNKKAGLDTLVIGSVMTF